MGAVLEVIMWPLLPVRASLVRGVWTPGGDDATTRDVLVRRAR